MTRTWTPTACPTPLELCQRPGLARDSPNLTSVDTAALNFLQEATVPLGAETHAGEDVAIFASGPKPHLVHGSMEQNWIFHVMHEAFDLDPKYSGMVEELTITRDRR